MGKRRNLNGLPNSLTQRFMSTLFYFDGGYMPDWIWETGMKYKTRKFKINILTNTFEPSEIQCPPIQHRLANLRTDISNTLSRERFDSDFIKEAYFIVELPEQYSTLRMISCQAILHDSDDRKFIGKIYLENSYGLGQTSNLKTIELQRTPNIFSKIKKWLKT